MSNTSSVNMINLQVMADDQIPDGAGTSVEQYGWKSTLQTYPTGMHDDPAAFVQNLRESLPEVNNIRVTWNQYSLDENGQLHPQFEQFLAEAKQQGFEITFVYGNNEFQQLGANGETADEIYDKLNNQIATAEQAYETLINRMEELNLSDAIYGYELINEPDAFMNGRDAEKTESSFYTANQKFIGQYLEAVEKLGSIVSENTDSKVVVGGLGYSSNFGAMNLANLDGINSIRELFGEDLIWSIHTHGGLNDIKATSEEEFIAKFEAYLAVLGSDDIIITETYLNNSSTDNFTGAESLADFFQSVGYQYLAERGIGIGWFPGAVTGAGHLVDLDNRGLVIKNQGSFAHANNAFTLGDDSEEASGDETIMVDIQSAVLRNKDGTFDDADLGLAFGFDGNDVITGTDTSNDFIYGGTGNDTISGGGADDYLFGQSGDDNISATSGNNHLYGGSGNDILSGGTGFDQLSGGSGVDEFIVQAEGDNLIVDFDPAQETIQFASGFTSSQEILDAATAVDADGDGLVNDVVITHPNGTSTTILNVALSDLNLNNLLIPGLTPNGVFDGTAGEDRIVVGSTDSQGDVIDHSGNTIYGNDGDDFISGGDGSDEIFGGDGNDTLRGNKGWDIIHGGNGDDIISGSKGVNTLFGDAGNDTIYSGDHSSKLYGGTGNDTLVAQFKKNAHHTLTGGEGADNFVFNMGSTSKYSRATVTDFDLGYDKLIIAGNEVDLLAPGEGISVTQTDEGVLVEFNDNEWVMLDGVDLTPNGIFDGIAGEDRIVVGSTDGQGDVIDHSGNTIYGNEGDDFISGGDGSDEIFGGDGNDTLRGNKGWDIIHGGNGDDIISGSKGVNTLFGDAGNDTIYSGDHSSKLYGGTGDDTLVAQFKKNAHHTLTGGEGADSFVFNLGSTSKYSRATVTDFELGYDKLIIAGNEVDLLAPGEGISVTQTNEGILVEFNDNEWVMLDGVFDLV